MKTLPRFLVITALAATLSGCLGGAEPDTGSHTQTLNAAGVEAVDVASVPTDLMSCDAFYGTDWDTPDTIVTVAGHPGQIILVQQGEMICSGNMNQIGDRLHGLDLGSLVPLNIPGDTLDGDDEDLDLGGGNGANNPAGDSNPLPANPGGDQSGDNPAGDSNPLPANPGDKKSRQNPAGDSNPLPARADIAPQTHSAGVM